MDRKHSFHQPTSSRRAVHAGLTVLELLVVMSIVGLVAALLLPAVMGARESARQTMCASHLREVGIAIHHHHDHHRRIPPAWVSARDDLEFAYGWASQLLPQIEQPGLQNLLSPMNRPPHLSNLAEAEAYSLPLLLCPSDIAEPSFGLVAEDEGGIAEAATLEMIVRAAAKPLVYLPTTNYIGVYGTTEADDFQEYQGAEGGSFGDGSVIERERVNFADLQRGMSQTLLVGERKMATVPSTWLGVDLRGEDAPCRVAGSAITAPNCETCDECEFSSRHLGGSGFLWADGHVTIISDSIDSELYRESARRCTFPRREVN